MIPSAARARFRDGLVTPTAGWCDGYTQANLISVPRDLAWDFLLFAQRNPRPCPVLDVLDAGAVAGPLADGDIRTDVPRYRVWVDGELAAEPSDVRDVWRPDLVSFLIGCSFTFEGALAEAGVPVRHVEQGVNVPMYRTSCSTCRTGTPAWPSAPSKVKLQPMRKLTRSGRQTSRTSVGSAASSPSTQTR